MGIGDVGGGGGGHDRAIAPPPVRASGADGPPPSLPAQVHEQLRHIASVRLAAQRAGYTLQATALVHEAYLKLRGSPRVIRGGTKSFLSCRR